MPLSGEWIDGAASFPSGDGAPGGAFRFGFRILPGDVDRNRVVDRADLRANLDSQFTALGSAQYSVFDDLDGDGAINILDWSRIRDRLPTMAPSASAPAAVVTDTTVPPAPTTLRAAAVDRAMVDRHSASADRPKNSLFASRTRAAKSSRIDYRSEIALPREFSSISSLSSRASQPIACMTRSRG
jgi:hypothetical protein